PEIEHPQGVEVREGREIGDVVVADPQLTQRRPTLEPREAPDGGAASAVVLREEEGREAPEIRGRDVARLLADEQAHGRVEERVGEHDRVALSLAVGSHVGEGALTLVAARGVDTVARGAGVGGARVRRLAEEAVTVLTRRARALVAARQVRALGARGAGMEGRGGALVHVRAALAVAHVARAALTDVPPRVIVADRVGMAGVRAGALVHVPAVVAREARLAPTHRRAALLVASEVLPEGGAAVALALGAHDLAPAARPGSARAPEAHPGARAAASVLASRAPTGGGPSRRAQRPRRIVAGARHDEGAPTEEDTNGSGEPHEGTQSKAIHGRSVVPLPQAPPQTDAPDPVGVTLGDHSSWTQL